MRVRRRPLVAVALAVATFGGALVVAGPAHGQDARAEALDAVDDFLDRYVQPSGRVGRLDQGDDTVSEGQAYAMLLTAATGDEARFRLVWAWTGQHLQRSDRLLAWRWDDGAVVDWSSATDADLIAAGALAIAGDRFDDAALAQEAAELSASILANETMMLGTNRVLLAGAWARYERVVNPSYFAVGMMSRLWLTADDRRWAPVAASSRAILDALTVAAPHLPPDWATIDASGSNPQARSSPNGDSPRYGYDAVRVIVQLAVDCNAQGQAIAARAWPFLERESAGGLAGSYALSGEVIDTNTHPVALVAAAASAGAAGDDEAMARLLDESDAHDGQHPTYYGAAWTALGRLWMDTDLIGGCRPGHPR